MTSSNGALISESLFDLISVAFHNISTVYNIVTTQCEIELEDFKISMSWKCGNWDKIRSFETWEETVEENGIRKGRRKAAIFHRKSVSNVTKKLKRTVRVCNRFVNSLKTSK